MPEHPRITDHARWNRARAFAGKQHCDVAVACDFADWVVESVRDGVIALPSKLETVFAAWVRQVADR